MTKCVFCGHLALNGERLERDGNSDWKRVGSSRPRHPNDKQACRNCVKAVLLGDEEAQKIMDERLLSDS